MATYAERAQLAVDVTFQGRVRNAAIKYALYLGPDPQPTGAWELARQVLSSPDHWTRQFALAVSTEPETLSGTDADPGADSDDGDAALTYSIEQRVWPAFSAGMALLVPPPADAP